MEALARWASERTRSAPISPAVLCSAVSFGSPAPGFESCTTQGYDINWVLAKISGIRNSIPGYSAMMETDLGIPAGTATPFFPTNLYYGLYGLPANTEPPTSGKYPHAYTKGEFAGDPPTVEAHKDGALAPTSNMGSIALMNSRCAPSPLSSWLLG